VGEQLVKVLRTHNGVFCFSTSAAGFFHHAGYGFHYAWGIRNQGVKGDFALRFCAATGECPRVCKDIRDLRLHQST
jgi:hypothetical protein